MAGRQHSPRNLHVLVDDPYRRCGLPANPFANSGPHDDVSWIDRGLLPAVPMPGRRLLVQVIGVKGAGKTTTLRHWRQTAPAPWRYVPRGVRRLRPLPVAPLVYWDEADRAPGPFRWWGLHAAARRGATVVAGTHVDLAAEALAAGLAVETVLLIPITAADVANWAARRFALVGAGPGWDLPDDVAADVAEQAGASWRVAGDLLHAWVAGEVATRTR
jgi:hypothetical protein